ncbi:MAG: flagellar hook assembly protein FlgD [Ramlibacter sp.]
MTTVTSTPSAAAPASTASSGTVGSLTSAADQEDRFMKLLVAQMQNQDPLNPMDNAQMTSQIAQINTVGGIEKLNTTVNSLLSAFNRMQAQSATQLAGREVLVDGNQIQLADGKAVGGVTLAGDADKVTVDILDAAGQVARSLQLGASPAGSRSFTWDGLLADGSQAAEGSWRIRATACSGSTAVTATTLTGATVNAVTSTTDGSTALDLGTAGVKTLDAVRSYL